MNRNDHSTATVATAVYDSQRDDMVPKPELPIYLSRKKAACYVREKWGLPCQPNWLAKLAVMGGGPVFRRCGRWPVYDRGALDDWARSRLSQPMTSTSSDAA